MFRKNLARLCPNPIYVHYILSYAPVYFGKSEMYEHNVMGTSIPSTRLHIMGNRRSEVKWIRGSELAAATTIRFRN